MDDQTLKQQVDSFFEAALRDCQTHDELASLAEEGRRRRSQIAKPMRVAFVGKTNAGKSTMMNAFLGEDIAPTGEGELTFNVSWFKYGEEPRLLVHTVDGNVEEEDFKSLGALSIRCQSSPAFFERIRFIEVYRPHPLLRNFDLIDTPGLHSFVQKDSKNTQQLLNDPENRPHAVVFLFSGTLQQADVDELANFHHSCGSLMSGLTAIGVLTKADGAPDWEKTFYNAERVLDQIQGDHPHMRRFFYTMMPAVGAAGFGAQTLSTQESETLAALATMEPARQKKLLRDVSRFTLVDFVEEPAIPSVEARSALFRRLGLFGIRMSLKLLGEGTPLRELPEALLAASNVAKVRDVVTAHFGGRAYLIKLKSALSALRKTAFELSQHLHGAPSAVAGRMAGQIDSLLANELRLQEFALLERYYQGQTSLADSHISQLLEVTGERGNSCAARLGKGPGTGLDELQDLAAHRQAYWRRESFRPGTDLNSKECARVLAESYGGLYSRVTRARKHLEAANALLTYEV